jgi:hypothetical protein
MQLNWRRQHFIYRLYNGYPNLNLAQFTGIAFG